MQFIRVGIWLYQQKQKIGNFFAGNLESICQKVNKNIDWDMKEEFYELLWGNTDIFIKNVIFNKDHKSNNQE